MPMQVELVSPERVLYSGDADMVIARTAGGDIAFLPGHAPFLGALGIGPVRVRPTAGSADVLAAVHGGFVEVSNDRVTILSDVAELADQIDVERARAAEERARRREDVGDDAEAEAALRRATVRLQVAEGA
jgi:F-type H+-transporting ATPase subunit epsilon